jgi:DNA-binding transcriptional regulator YbjK
MMTQTPANVEEKIVFAAIDCIEKYGLDGATNRKIAAAAGVNSAAINYYFRSKDILIKRCMDTTLENAFGWNDIPDMPGLNAKERCTAIFLDLTAGGMNYPGITRAHFHSLIVDGEYDQLLQEKMSSFIEHMVIDLAERSSTLDTDELRLAVMQITYSVTMMILAPKIFERRFGVDMHDPQMREKFVTRLVDRLL